MNFKKKLIDDQNNELEKQITGQKEFEITMEEKFFKNDRSIK